MKMECRSCKKDFKGEMRCPLCGAQLWKKIKAAPTALRTLNAIDGESQERASPSY